MSAVPPLAQQNSRLAVAGCMSVCRSLSPRGPERWGAAYAPRATSRVQVLEAYDLAEKSDIPSTSRSTRTARRGR
jgi:hypothetical protein